MTAALSRFSHSRFRVCADGPVAMASVLVIALASAFVSAVTRLYGNTYVQETYLMARPELPELD